MAHHWPFALKNGIASPTNELVIAIGNMSSTTYDPDLIQSNFYDREYHTGTISAVDITGLSKVAFLNVGLTVGKVAPGYHVHFCCDGNMAANLYDPQGINKDVFNRENHTDTQNISTVTGLNQVATLNVGGSSFEVSAGDHYHPYLDYDIYNPRILVSDAFNRSSHSGLQSIDTISGLGDSAPLSVGQHPNEVASGYHTEYHLMVGADEYNNGKIGVPPQPHPRDNLKVLYGLGYWGTPFLLTHDLHVNKEAVPTMLPSSLSTDGNCGLSPKPLAGDDFKVLTSNGLWEYLSDILSYLPSIPLNILPQFTAVSSGIVPKPKMNENYKLLADGVWKSLNEILQNTVLHHSIFTPFVGAGATPGEIGVVPKPLASDYKKLLLGNGTWSTANEAITLSNDVLAVADIPVFTQSDSGLVPKPFAGDNKNVLAVYGEWATPSEIVDSMTLLPISSIPEMIAAEPMVHGSAGMLPKPLQGDNSKILRGDKTWVTINQALLESGSTFNTDKFEEMFGPTDDADGYKGLVPKPLASMQSYVLTSSSWKSFDSVITDGSEVFDRSAVATMLPAATETSGVHGFVPQPMVDDVNKFLVGGATWMPASNNVVYIGEWDTSITYNLNNIVLDGANSFICVLENNGQTTTDVTYWKPFCSSGQIGFTGPQGKGLEIDDLETRELLHSNMINSTNSIFDGIVHSYIKNSERKFNRLLNDSSLSVDNAIFEDGGYINTVYPFVGLDSKGKVLQDFKLSFDNLMGVATAVSVPSIRTNGIRLCLKMHGSHGLRDGSLDVLIFSTVDGTPGIDGKLSNNVEMVAECSMVVSDIKEDYEWYTIPFPTIGISGNVVIAIAPTDIGQAYIFVAITNESLTSSSNLFDFEYTSVHPHVGTQTIHSDKDLFFVLERETQPLTISDVIGIAPGNIGVIAGGYNGNAYTDGLEKTNIAIGTTTTNFGALSIGRGGCSSISNGMNARMLICGGIFGASSTNIIESVIITTPANASSFGELTTSSEGQNAVSNGTDARGVVSNHGSGSSFVDILNIDSISNAASYQGYGLQGDKTSCASVSNGKGSRALFVGGTSSILSEGTTSINYWNIKSLGAVRSFGDLNFKSQGGSAISDDVNKVVVAGGYSENSSVSNIDYLGINTLSNATVYGNLSEARYCAASLSNGTNNRGLFCGSLGSPSVSNPIKSIDSIRFDTGAGVTDFGDLLSSKGLMSGASNSAL